ncbi:hypothetical protein PanWU01x14_009690 [Parasponia andersonii]|uniref:Uncharacterized protein n=1 Tax=Parasponia andersonii TaxID=3476 RepID=A0A2P5E2J7_PARAD|nr:hypothetical protein PanWU01x14_009690 [Parasponia andersonii]
MSSSEPANSVSESVGSAFAPNALTDDKIIEIVRGTRSRYKKGKGALRRFKATGGTRAPSSSSSSTLATKQAETIAILQRQIS